MEETSRYKYVYNENEICMMYMIHWYNIPWTQLTR